MAANYDKRQLLYNTIFAQCFSPCGKYLSVADRYGKTTTYSLSSVLAPTATDESRQAMYKFETIKGSQVPIYCTTSTDDFFICGVGNRILAYNWEEIIRKNAQLDWAITIPQKQNTEYFQVDYEINALITDPQDCSSPQVYAGSGNGNVYCFDLSTGKCVQTFTGHTDMVLCLSQSSKKRDEIYSGSEDGSVRVWDKRVGNEAQHIIEPSKNELCARPDLGSFISCLAVDDDADFLACGGGAKLAFWHLKSLNVNSVCDAGNACQNTAVFIDNELYSGGNDQNMYKWAITGNLVSSIPMSSHAIYSITYNHASSSHQILSIGGNSHYLDICINKGYRSFSLSLI